VLPGGQRLTAPDSLDVLFHNVPSPCGSRAGPRCDPDDLPVVVFEFNGVGDQQQQRVPHHSESLPAVLSALDTVVIHQRLQVIEGMDGNVKTHTVLVRVRPP
jgi:hypothetical protein